MVRRTSLSSSQAPYCSRGVTLAGFEITHAEAQGHSCWSGRSWSSWPLGCGFLTSSSGRSGVI